MGHSPTEGAAPPKQKPAPRQPQTHGQHPRAPQRDPSALPTGARGLRGGRKEAPNSSSQKEEARNRSRAEEEEAALGKTGGFQAGLLPPEPDTELAASRRGAARPKLPAGVSRLSHKKTQKKATKSQEKSHEKTEKKSHKTQSCPVVFPAPPEPRAPRPGRGASGCGAPAGSWCGHKGGKNPSSDVLEPQSDEGKGGRGLPLGKSPLFSPPPEPFLGCCRPAESRARGGRSHRPPRSSPLVLKMSNYTRKREKFEPLRAALVPRPPGQGGRNLAFLPKKITEQRAKATELLLRTTAFGKGTKMSGFGPVLPQNTWGSTASSPPCWKQAGVGSVQSLFLYQISLQRIFGVQRRNE